MSERESMKETVIFDGRTGSVLAIMGECDTEHVEALVIDVPAYHVGNAREFADAVK